MKGKLGDKVRLQHILDALDEIDFYLTNVSYEQFLSNSEKRFATVYYGDCKLRSGRFGFLLS
ncbi:MAG: hypothetical protein ABI203_02445 [Mucilaginibacter sp.]